MEHNVSEVIRRVQSRFLPSMVKGVVDNFRRKYKPLFYPSDLEAFYQALSSTELEESLRRLNSEFGKRGIRADSLDAKWWEDLYIASHTVDNSEGIEAQTRMCDHIISLRADKVFFWDLLHIYRLCFRVGLINVGLHIRRKALLAAISDASISTRSYFFLKTLAGLLEADRWDIFESRSSSLSARFRESGYQLGRLHKLLRGDNLNLNDGFARFVSGKTIALVGPAKTTAEDGLEIDSFDVVVRFNHREEGLGDPLIKGARCDISYYSGEQTQYIVGQNAPRLPKSVTWAVCKTSKDARGLQQAIKNQPIKVRSLWPMHGAWFNGTMNAVPNAIVDLIGCNPKRIKTFHADLMLTQMRFEGYYPSEFDYDCRVDELFIQGMAAAHDPVTQYWPLNHLFRQGRIEGDPRFEYVMKIGLTQYMGKLQSIYGHAGRMHCQS